MPMRIWSVGLDKEEDEVLRKIFDPYTQSEVLRAALDALLAITFIRPLNSGTVGIIVSARANGRRMGIPVPTCMREGLSLASGSVWCM